MQKEQMTEGKVTVQWWAVDEIMKYIALNIHKFHTIAGKYCFLRPTFYQREKETENNGEQAGS